MTTTSIMAFTSYDTLKGRRILRVGGDWGHKRTRMIKIWTVGQVTAAEPGSAFGDPHKKREDDNDNDNGNS